MINGKSEFLKQLFLVLNTNHIEYFIFGEYRNLPESTGSSDLDLMVNPKQIDQFILVLHRLLRHYNIKIASYYTNNNALFYRLISNSNCYWGIQLDIFHKGFFYQTKEYFPIIEIQKDIIIHNGIRVLDFKKAYLIGFLKEIIHNHCSKDKYINGFIDEVLTNELKYRKLFASLYGSKFVEIVFNNLDANGLKSQTKNLGNIIFKNIYNGSFASLLKIGDKIKYLKRGLNKPGYTIAFLGTDGSGKSTIINKITPIINEAFHNSVYYEHLRPNCLPSFAQLLGKNEYFSQPVTDPHSKNPSGFIGSFFRWSFYLLDYTLGYWFKVFPKKIFKSCVWIFDRYYYDYLIDKRRTMVNLPNWLLRLGQALISEPDLIICLGAEPDAIYARKPELSLKEVKRQVTALSIFCKSNKRAVWIDTGQSIDQTVSETMDAVYVLMSKRFEYIRKY